MEDREARRLVGSVETALARLDDVAEAERAVAHEAIAGLCELYGEALRRLLAEGGRRDDASWLLRFARSDELLAHLLMLHGLHPDGADTIEKLFAEERPPAAGNGQGNGHHGRPRAEPELVTLGRQRARHRQPLESAP